jgi:hypothetical protein
MAKARTVEPEQRPDVELTLTWEEARTLLTVTNYVGGSPEPDRPRQHIDAIGRALEALAIRPRNGLSGSLRFID